jgi:hypothetical protein
MPILLLAGLLAACGTEEPPAEPRPPEGRTETQAIRNTEAVGIAGDAIADKVDAALDKNDENVKKVGQEAAEQPD